MSKKIAFAAVLVAFVAACAPKPEPEPVVVAPVTTEPVYQGKYGN